MTPTLAQALSHIAPAYSAREHTRAAERMMEDMEKTAHTPGPWQENEGFVVGPDFETVCDPRCLPPTADNIATMEANARLIAASPDLLRACETLANYFAGHDPNDIPAECGSGVRAALIQARLAVAKAKGGAQ